jgi:uncharacterized protein YwgA
MTDATKFKLLAIFKATKQRIRMSTFDDRLALQKKVYLLQELGLRLGNSYGWYLRGPYSREVASDGFYLEKIQDQITDLAEPSASDIVITKKLIRIVNEAETALGKNEAYCLELIASLHFVLKYGYPKPPSKEVAIWQLTQQKTKFTIDEGKIAMHLLEQNGLA